MSEHAADEPLMEPRPRLIALITGASGGIGAELARVFAGAGHELALVARDVARLAALADEIVESGAPRPLLIVQDLTGAQAVDNVLAAIANAGASVKYLVNNAGFGLLGDAAALPRAGQLDMIDLNIRALADMSLALLPDLARNGGKILNVASVAAFVPGPGLAIYYSSKAFVLSFSEALAQEMRPHGVSVTVLCPGPTATGFQARAGFAMAATLGRLPMRDARSVAEAGYAGLMQGRRVIIPGLANRLLVMLVKMLPHAITLPMIAALQGRRAKSA